MRFILLTGLSGAGKTNASRYLEDLGALCVDNMPPMMMVKFMEMCQTSMHSHNVVALSVDIRSGEFFDADDVNRLINEARVLGYDIQTIFLEASDDSLISRYKETRREHPLANDKVSLTEAIAKEREMLVPLREDANRLIDTTGMSLRQLKKIIQTIVQDEDKPAPLRIEVMSFGFKRGIPKQSDLVYDVRFLPNPFYIKVLGRHTGLDEDVRTFVMDNPVTVAFVEKLRDMLSFLIPHYQEEGKHRLVIAIGCTGGAHRSVAIAEDTAKFLRDNGYQVDVNHRDLELEQAHWKAGTDSDSGD